MLSLFSDFDSTARLFEELRRQHGYGYTQPEAAGFGEDGPRLTLRDDGETLTVEGDLPGFTEKDVTVSVHQEVVTLRGQRKVAAPEGYTAHRRERGDVRFVRSFSVPTRIDVDRVEASVKDGVLTVRLPKAKEAQPRQIAVKS